LRRLIAVALLGLGCASPGMPPGGPPDAAAPEIVSITPDSGKVGVKPKEVLFRFDEVVSERPPGATTLGDLFLISPRDGVPQASWHREVIGVRPSHGWRNNTPYTVIMMRGLADLRGNVRNTGASTFFSTGSTIPETRISGSVFDWVAGTPAKGAIVESFVPPDTLHPYVALVDSNGLFAIEHVPPARYVLRAYIDRNKNLSVDPSEPWDSVGITLSDSVQSTLLIFVHDTVPPRLRELRYVDSVTIQAAFDRPIDPAQTLGVANFAVTGPDSTAIPIASVNPPAADTTAARPGAPAPAPAPAPAAAAVRPAGRARPALTRPDTTAAAPKPVMPKPSPVSEVVIKLQRTLTPKAAYRVRAIGIRGLLGKVGDSERTLTIPAPVPPATPPTPPKGAASSTPSALR
jgi:hypothetical protein